MGREVSTYRRIVKSTGLFGGVQGVNILCSIVRTKCLALWLGPEGVGILGLYTQASETIAQITGLGLRQSGVRDMSVACREGDVRRMERVRLVLRRWSLTAGLLGAMVMLLLAPALSRWTFGDSLHIWGFVFLSGMLLMNALVSGEQAIVQGSGRLKILARSGVWAAVVSLGLSLLLYYFLRIDGIVPSLLVISAVTLFFLFFYSRRGELPLEQPAPGWGETLRDGYGMVKLGVYMTVSGFVVTLFSYLFSAWMNHRGGTVDVGYYQAGYNLMNRYFGLIFTAMGMEFYPRLASVCDDRAEMSRHVSQQAEISLFILIPTIGLMLLFKGLVVRLLYTADFRIIEGYLLWSVPGVLFKAVSWAMAFILLAKGAGRLFLVTEIVSACITLGLNLLGYRSFGLAGVGMAYTLSFFVYTLYIGFICRGRFGLRLTGSFWRVFAAGCGFSLLTFLCVGTEMRPAAYAVVAGGIVYSLWMLKKRLGLRRSE